MLVANKPASIKVATKSKSDSIVLKLGLQTKTLIIEIALKLNIFGIICVDEL